jgi:integrase
MAREVNRLSARTVATISKPGRHSDGAGLYLVVDPSGAKRWLFLFRWQGKLKEMGLGGLSSVSLADAREKAGDARKLVASGQNPIEEKRRAKAESTSRTTFGRFADDLVAELSKGFRNDKHKWQWSQTLNDYAGQLRPKFLDEITTADVLAVLQPIWTTKHETASRLRGRIERVLDAAKAKGLRTGENPARWRGHLDHLLSRRQKLQRGHHAAVPFQEMPALLENLREREAVAALALEFLILCAARTGEVIGAKWSEVDLDAGVWTVPAERMKGGREHRVPLSSRALELLSRAQVLRSEGDYVFPGGRPRAPLSNMAMDMLLRRLKRDETVHGFRSSFRDWAGETTSFPREIAEQALSHVVGDEVERAYRRGDALERRRQLMEAWASYLVSPPITSNVVQLSRAEAP